MKTRSIGKPLRTVGAWASYRLPLIEAVRMEEVRAGSR